MLLYADDGDAAVAAVLQRGLRPDALLVRRGARWRMCSSSSRAAPWSTERCGPYGQTGEHFHGGPCHRVSPGGVPPAVACHLRTAFFTPLFYLTALGLGLGSLIDQNPSAGARLDGVSYAAFIGPGLLAATGMSIGGLESTWPVLASMKWSRTFYAMTATPVPRRRRGDRAHALDDRPAVPRRRRVSRR